MRDESLYFELKVELNSVFAKEGGKRRGKDVSCRNVKDMQIMWRKTKECFYGERLAQGGLRSLKKGLLCCLCKPMLCDFPLNREVFLCCCALGNKDEKPATIWLQVFNKVQVFL